MEFRIEHIDALSGSEEDNWKSDNFIIEHKFCEEYILKGFSNGVICK